MLMKTKQERSDILTNPTMLMIIKDIRFVTHDVDDNKCSYGKTEDEFRMATRGRILSSKEHPARAPRPSREGERCQRHLAGDGARPGRPWHKGQPASTAAVGH